MASKAEIRNYIKENFKYEDTDDLDTLKVVVELADGRTQMAFVILTDIGIAINSIFAHKDDLTPGQAMNLADDQLLGIKLLHNFYAVTHFVLSEDIDASEINKGILFCAIQADKMEQEVGGDRF
jgi:hypothetical protein